MGTTNRIIAAGDDPPLHGDRPIKGRRVRPPVVGLARAVFALARAHRRLHHWPTWPQLLSMAHYGGDEPCSYLLDPRVNFVPPLPSGSEREFGRQALCFTCQIRPGRDSELVVFPSGNGFDLL